MLSIVMLSVIIPNVVMLNVVAFPQRGLCFEPFYGRN
jgi:hypothetical protein